MSKSREKIKDYCDRENIINPMSGIRIPYEMVDELLVEFALLERIKETTEILLEQGDQWYGFKIMPGIDKEYRAVHDALKAVEG